MCLEEPGSARWKILVDVVVLNGLPQSYQSLRAKQIKMRCRVLEEGNREDELTHTDLWLSANDS